MVRLSMNKAFAASALVLASVGKVAADLQVTNPSSSSWWVAQSTNLLSWTCDNTTIGNFTVLVANQNTQILASPQAIIAIQENFQCSILITQDEANQAAGTGWEILLADPFNNTNVFATSQPFEIKPLGSTYPPQTTAGVATASGTVSGSGAVASPTATPKSGALHSAGLSMGLLAAGIAAAVGVWA